MRGGKRYGAGRKKGFAAKSSESARALLARMLEEEIYPIGQALIEKAKKGDIAAARELFDRAWGKPQQIINLPPQGTNEEISPYLKNPDIKRVAEEYELQLKELLKGTPKTLG